MSQSDDINLQQQDLVQFFIHHLNKIYTAKTLLVAKLPGLLDNAYFSDLQSAIQETIQVVRKQITRMDMIFRIMDSKVSDAHANGLKGLIKDSFDDIRTHEKNHELRDMSILFYLHNIESVEMASFQILEMLAVKLQNDQIKQLVKQNYHDAKADRTLILLISAKYISTV